MALSSSYSSSVISFSILFLLLLSIMVTAETMTTKIVDNKKSNKQATRISTFPKNRLPSSLTSMPKQQACGSNDDDDNNNNSYNNIRDPALQLMTYNVGDGEKTVWVYREPKLQDMFFDEKVRNNNNNTTCSATTTKVHTPGFHGLAVKFINLSNKTVTLYWEAYEGAPKHAISHHLPFTASGTASIPGKRFFFSDDNNNPGIKLQSYVIQNYPYSIYSYDPYYIPNNPKQTDHNLQQLLSKDEREQYNNWRRTILFHEQYLQFTGRSYLANYLRHPPIHHMWRADYFGQEHWVMTKEKHFVRLPQHEYDLQPIIASGTDRILSNDQPRMLEQYRDPAIQLMNMTLKVLSVVPRVFEVSNFLSQAEVAHIIQVAAGINLNLSKTAYTDPTKTRSSYNSWVKRETSPIIDAIYRRAADLLQIEESLFRHRSDGEYDTISTKSSIAEALQLVHYNVGQEYRPHHDFGYTKSSSSTSGQQCQRFATLLLYLNDNMSGGETVFPRCINGEPFPHLMVKPQTGKAILFYSQLPDGNMDDLSQHASLPVTDGEKWLMNLWVWDPVHCNQ